MPILVRRKGENWQRANDVEFADEAELQKMLYEGPELVSLRDEHPAVFIREAGLPGSGRTDLLGVDADGNILIVETKLFKSREIRREVIGQILEYAAYLWRMSYAKFDGLFLTREGKSIAELLMLKTSQQTLPEFQDTVAANLQSGVFHLFIAVDEMNDELEKIIAYVSSLGPTLKLQALELRTYKFEDLEILAPQHYGEYLQPPASPRAIITIDQILANCPEHHSRQLFGLLVDEWKKLGHEVRPGVRGASFRASVGAEPQTIFWAFPDCLQGQFKMLLDNEAPPKGVQAFRSAASQLHGFDQDRFMHDSAPKAKFASLTDSEIRKFLEESERMVQAWREALHASMRSDSDEQTP